MRTGLVSLCLCIASSAALPAGNGAGAGGAGHQRAINSGLPAGEAGPPGAPNNPRRTPELRTGDKDASPAKSSPLR